MDDNNNNTTTNDVYRLLIRVDSGGLSYVA